MANAAVNRKQLMLENCEQKTFTANLQPAASVYSTCFLSARSKNVHMCITDTIIIL